MSASRRNASKNYYTPEFISNKIDLVTDSMYMVRHIILCILAELVCLTRRNTGVYLGVIGSFTQHTRGLGFWGVIFHTDYSEMFIVI